MRATAHRIDALVADLHPDILHAHSPVLNAIPALWVGRRRRIPVVYEVRASWEDAAVDHGTTREGSLRYRATRALETFALRRADAVTTICEGLRNDIALRGIDVGRITVVANAVDIESFKFRARPDAELRRAIDLEGANVVGFAGSFYAYEGLDLLLEAVASLASQVPDLRVLLVGGGPQELALREQAARLRIADRVIFTGRVPHDAVARYYGLIDILVYPRRSMRLTELVTPLKPLEAMAQGRIVIASDVGGHRELIRDGETGFMFAAGDADALARTIASVLQRRPEWSAMQERGRRFVETERTWSRSAAHYVQVYERLLGTVNRTLADAPLSGG